jgi:mannose-6-phosphate isomerase-like protein (cupin superfamily)
MESENRPWGSFYVVDEGPGFKVKRIATVTVGKSVQALKRGQSIDIPFQAIHRLENLHKGEVVVIEVQFGDYLGEDDIIRYKDVYQRG